MVRVGIIADDYTGAADAGVQFAKKGLKTSILTDPKRIRETVNRVDVLVVDTEIIAKPSQSETCHDLHQADN